MIRTTIIENKLNSLNSKYWGIVLAVVVILNLIIRFLALPTESIYGDEGFTIFFSQQTPQLLFDRLMYDRNPPLYFFMLHYWIKVFGIGSFYLKGFSALMSTGTAFFLFKLSDRYLNRLSAIIVSILFLFSEVQMMISHELRAFALVGFLTALSFYLFLNTLKREKKWSLAGLAIVNVLLMFTHYIAVFVPVVEFIAGLLFFKSAKKGFKYLIISFVISVVLYLPWAKIVFENIPEAGTFWLAIPGLPELRYIFEKFSVNMTFLKIHTALVVGFGFLVIFDKKRRFLSEKFDVKIFILLLLWYILPVIGDFLIAQFTPVFRLRYVLFSSLGFYLLLAYIVSSLRINIIVELALILLILYIPFRSFHVYRDVSENWKKLVPEVMKLQPENNIVLISAWYKFRDFTYYYNRDYFSDYENTISHLGDDDIYCLNDSSGFRTIDYSKAPRIILISSHTQIVDSEKTIDKFLKSHKYKLCDEFGVPGIEVAVYNQEFLSCDSLVAIQQISELPDKCAEWKKSVFRDVQTNDTVTSYFNNIEYDSACDIPKNISSLKAYSGFSSCLVNDSLPYSSTFKANLVDIPTLHSVKVSLNVLTNVNSKAALVISIDRGNKSLFREVHFFAGDAVSENEWYEVTKSVKIPEVKDKEAVLKVYIWNPSGDDAFVDDIEVQIR